MPTIGSPAPEFTLKDQDQKDIKLSDYKGKKNVVIVFYPSTGAPPAPKSTPAWSTTKNNSKTSTPKS